MRRSYSWWKAICSAQPFFCLFLVAVLLAGLIPSAFADDIGTSAETSGAATMLPDETASPANESEPSQDTQPDEPVESEKTTEETGSDEEQEKKSAIMSSRLLASSASTYAANTVSNVLLFDQARVSMSKCFARRFMKRKH